MSDVKAALAATVLALLVGILLGLTWANRVGFLLLIQG